MPAESTFKTKCSMNEFAQLDLLMNLYIMDYYHTPVLPPVGKKCQPKENKKGCWHRACCSQEPASQPSPPSGGDAKAWQGHGEVFRMEVTLKWEEASMWWVRGAYLAFSGWSWVEMDTEVHDDVSYSSTPAIQDLFCHRAVFYFLIATIRQWSWLIL